MNNELVSECEETMHDDRGNADYRPSAINRGAPIASISLHGFAGVANGKCPVFGRAMVGISPRITFRAHLSSPVRNDHQEVIDIHNVIVVDIRRA